MMCCAKHKIHENHDNGNVYGTPKKKNETGVKKERKNEKIYMKCQSTTIEAGRTKYTIYVNSLKISELCTALE